MKRFISTIIGTSLIIGSNADDMSKTMLPEHSHVHHLVRTLGLVDVVMIGIAGMIGGVNGKKDQNCRLISQRLN